MPPVTFDGWVAGTFMLDPAGGQMLLNRLDAIAPPDPGDASEGPRSLAQRRADALTELAAADAGKPTANPPSLNVVVDLPALTGDGVAQLAARRDLDGIGPIDRNTFERLACCGTVTRLATAGRSVIVDMGQADSRPAGEFVLTRPSTRERACSTSEARERSLAGP